MQNWLIHIDISSYLFLTTSRLVQQNISTHCVILLAMKALNVVHEKQSEWLSLRSKLFSFAFDTSRLKYFLGYTSTNTWTHACLPCNCSTAVFAMLQTCNPNQMSFQSFILHNNAVDHQRVPSTLLYACCGSRQQFMCWHRLFALTCRNSKFAKVTWIDIQIMISFLFWKRYDMS